MTSAVYPNTTFSWTDRIDNENVGATPGKDLAQLIPAELQCVVVCCGGESLTR